VKYGLLSSNPVENVRMPAERRGKRRNKPYLSQEQVSSLIELMPEPYATMVYVAIYTGLRISEVAALRWEDIHHDSITIDERFCRGDWAAPKSESSNATIGVNRCVIERVHRMKKLTVRVRAGRASRLYQVVKSDGPTDLVFQSVREGKPMRDGNILRRFINPAARSLGLGWVNWQSLRTSHAVWLKMAGADVKDAQGQMRHAQASTTLNIYQQFVPESQRRVVNMLSSLSTQIQ
jgi:integrase